MPLFKDDRTLFFFGACCKRGRQLYTTTAPSYFIPASYCHLPSTLQTISITIVNLQVNRAVFRIFIALLKLSFDSHSYHLQKKQKNFLIRCATNNFSLCTIFPLTDVNSKTILTLRNSSNAMGEDEARKLT